MIQMLLILSIILAVMAIQTRKLRNSVIYLGAFSMCLALIYLLYHAPDVAIAEAIIGSSLSTILLLVALQKYKVFNIYYQINEEEVQDSHVFSTQKQQLLKIIESYCNKQELEAHVIYTVEEVPQILHHDYALVIEEKEGQINIYGHPENYKFNALINLLQGSHPEITYIQVKEEII